MVDPTYSIHRIDGNVDEDVIVTVKDGWNTKSSITLLAGQYVTVIVMTNKEKECEHLQS
jgi:hypothetical protein